MIEIERTDKTIKGAIMSIALTSLAIFTVGAMAATMLAVPLTTGTFTTVVITALAGGIFDIEVSY
jgi:hypothetical protein